MITSLRLRAAVKLVAKWQSARGKVAGNDLNMRMRMRKCGWSMGIVGRGWCLSCGEGIMRHAGDVCNYSPSSHFDGGCPIASLLGTEPNMVQTDQAVPAPLGCYCFPLLSPGKDQTQSADRRELALYMRTLTDGRCLNWSLNRSPGQEKWMKMSHSVGRD